MRYGVVVAALVAWMAWGCTGEDPVAAAARAICDGIDAEPSDEVAFQGLERAMARERRAGTDEAELRAAVEDRCGRAVSAISAAALEAVEPDEEEPEAELEPEPVFVDLASLDWLNQTWPTECTSDGQQRGLRLSTEEGVGAVHRPTDGALTPVYVVDVDDIVFGDLTGNGYDDAVFMTQCVFASGQPFVEVWSHDDDGQPVHLGPVVFYSKFDAMVESVEVVDGRLRIHTAEAGPHDTHPHLNGYPISVVTDWSFDGASWSAQEISRSEEEPPAATPERDAVDITDECSDAGIELEATALCLVAAINAQDYTKAAPLTTDAVLDELRYQRENGGLLNWDFERCDARSCWFYEPSPDPNYHGMVIELWLETVQGGWKVVIYEAFG